MSTKNTGIFNVLLRRDGKGEGRKIKQHIFYVLDDNIRYEHIIEEPIAEKPKKENRGTRKFSKYL